jgi:hypothetical protein
VGIERPSQILGLTTPLISIAAEQLFQENPFTGKDWALNRQTRAATHEQDHGVNGRVIANRLLNFVYPYRLATKTGIPNVDLPGIGHVPGTGVKPMLGPQGDDSLLWWQRPTKFKDEAIASSVARGIQQEGARGGKLADQMLPLFRRQPDYSVAAYLSDRQRKGKGTSAAPTASETAAFRKQIIASGYTPQEADAILRKAGYKK